MRTIVRGCWPEKGSPLQGGLKSINVSICLELSTICLIHQSHGACQQGFTRTTREGVGAGRQPARKRAGFKRRASGYYDEELRMTAAICSAIPASFLWSCLTRSISTSSADRSSGLLSSSRRSSSRGTRVSRTFNCTAGTPSAREICSSISADGKALSNSICDMNAGEISAFFANSRRDRPICLRRSRMNSPRVLACTSWGFGEVFNCQFTWTKRAQIFCWPDFSDALRCLYNVFNPTSYEPCMAHRTFNYLCK